MVTGAPGVLGPPAPVHVDREQEESLEVVTTQHLLMGDDPVRDQAATIRVAETLNHVDVQVFIKFFGLGSIPKKKNCKI